jgi:hypothetical protein
MPSPSKHHLSGSKPRLSLSPSGIGGNNFPYVESLKFQETKVRENRLSIHQWLLGIGDDDGFRETGDVNVFAGRW